MPCKVLKVIQRFDKHCIAIVTVSIFCGLGSSYIDLAAGGWHEKSCLRTSLLHPNKGLQTQVRVKIILRPMVRRPVYLGVRHPSGAQDQIYITVRQLRVCWCGALSLTRGRVCRLQLLLVLASTVILGSESHGTRDHILLSQIWDSPNLEGQIPVFLSPSDRVAQLYL
jgi:hypothetical protein